MMGGLAVAWQVKVTLSPSRTERGSMDRVTMGGSTQEKQHMINVNVLSSGSGRTIDFSTQIRHTNFKLEPPNQTFQNPIPLFRKTSASLQSLWLFWHHEKTHQSFLIENSNHTASS